QPKDIRNYKSNRSGIFAMPFVPNCEHDVFVSYSTLDNDLLPGINTGWVTTLKQALEISLRRKLGSRDLSVWMDPEMAGNIPLTDQIKQTLKKTAVLLVLLSPGYLTSHWCQDERRWFLESVKARTHKGSRIFVIEVDRVEDGARPQEFNDLLRYRF